jgi:hypothetical protein
MILSQNDMGRAFEYSLAVRLAEYLPATFNEDKHVLNAQSCFAFVPDSEKLNMIAAAREAVAFLVAHDNRLAENGCSITMQTDQAGMHGDVRDIIIHNQTLNQDIGISAKNRHWALKHSRLSEDIDFGYEWMGIHCSPAYIQLITPIFRELRSRQRHGEKWHDIPDKIQRYYMPILQAFQIEIHQLFKNHPNEVSKALMKYLLGKYEHYKVVKENGEVSITSFNIDGHLKWGSKIPLPTNIIEIRRKANSQTTVIITFDKGWQISFRIHNASTYVEPSLKFDITIIGQPAQVSRHVINYLG